MSVTPPSIEARLAIMSPTSRVTRRVDIYEADGETLWHENAPFTDGSVSVDQGRDERRTLDVTLDNRDRELGNHPEGLWYDKIIKPSRGVRYQLGDQYAELIKSKNPAGYWRMGSVVNVPDESGNGLPLDQVTGDPRVVGALISSHDRTTAARFDPSVTLASMASGNVPAGNPVRELQGGHTWEAWVVMLGAPDSTFNMFLGRQGRHYVSISPGGSVRVSTDINGTQRNSQLTSPSGTIEMNRRHHIVVIVTPDWGRIYVDSVLVGSHDGWGLDAPREITSWEDSEIGIRVGAHTSTGLPFDGVVDEVAIYNYPLTAASVKENYERGRQAGYSEATWETQLGEFYIDDIASPRFPRVIAVRGRDYTKKLLNDKFPTATLFDEAESVESVVQAVALNGGISKLNLPTTGQVIGLDMMFERGTPRWQVIKKIATDFGWELFFDAAGYLTMREFRDPSTSPTSFEFDTGAGGTMVDFGRKVNDTFIKNHVVVSGENSDQVPVFAEVENNEPGSPTRIANLGRRTWEYVSQYITEYQQALDVANNFIKVQALESFEVSIDSLVLPWLEVGEIIRFHDPEPNPGDPERYLLDSTTIPLTLTPMGSVGKRITIVG